METEDGGDRKGDRMVSEEKENVKSCWEEVEEWLRQKKIGSIG